MQSVIPIDAEYALSIDIAEYWNHPVYPTPLPDNYQDSLPCALVTLVGGGDTSMVTYQHSVSIDVYAATFAEAIEEAGKVAGIVTDLPYRVPKSKRQWLTAGTDSLPYANPDPSNFKVPRASFTANVTIRGTISSI